MASVIRVISTLLLIAQLMAFTACAESAHQTGQALFDKVIPSELRQQIDAHAFSELQAHPEQFEGKSCAWGAPSFC